MCSPVSQHLYLCRCDNIAGASPSFTHLTTTTMMMMMIVGQRPFFTENPSQVLPVEKPSVAEPSHTNSFQYGQKKFDVLKAFLFSSVFLIQKDLKPQSMLVTTCAVFVAIRLY